MYFLQADKSAAPSTLLLPDFTVETVDLLLDLLYTGEAASTGSLDPGSGELCLGQLYRALGLDAEGGGLPDIEYLDTVPAPSPRHRTLPSGSDVIR